MKPVCREHKFLLLLLFVTSFLTKYLVQKLSIEPPFVWADDDDDDGIDTVQDFFVEVELIFVWKQRGESVFYDVDDWLQINNDASGTLFSSAIFSAMR